MWILPAGALIGSVCVVAVVVRRLAAESRRLHRSLDRLARVVVATDDAAREFRHLGPGPSPR